MFHFINLDSLLSSAVILSVMIDFLCFPSLIKAFMLTLFCELFLLFSFPDLLSFFQLLFSLLSVRYVTLLPFLLSLRTHEHANKCYTSVKYTDNLHQETHLFWNIVCNI